MKLLQFLLLLAVAGGIWYIAVNGLVTTTNSTMAGINVNADAKVTVTPDVAILRVSISELASTAVQAQKQGADIVSTVTSYLMTGGVDKKDIQSSYYNVMPDYDYSTSSTGILRGYRATHELIVKIRDLTGSNQLVGGITTISGASVSSFTYDIENIDTAISSARTQAMQKAHDKAQALADAANVTLGKLVTVNENASPVGGPYPMMAKSEAMDSSAGTIPTANLQQGTIEVTLSISASYEIK